MKKGGEWIPSDLNDGHLDYYFYLLASIMFIAYLAFVYISRKYVYVSTGHFESASGGGKAIEESVHSPILKTQRHDDEF
jgi:peptide/histidine transporter 3/4